jgi:glycosyltransferase involved in cell wall biosynthesis
MRIPAPFLDFRAHYCANVKSPEQARSALRLDRPAASRQQVNLALSVGCFLYSVILSTLKFELAAVLTEFDHVSQRTWIAKNYVFKKYAELARVMKTVLVVLPLEPHRDGVGSQKRAASHVAALLMASKVHLVVFDSDTTSSKLGDEDLYARCESVVVVKYIRRPRRAVLPLPLFSLLAEIYDSTIARRLPAPALVRDAFAKVRGQRIDTVFCFKVLGATVYDYVQKLAPFPVVQKIVDFDDVESLPDAPGVSMIGRGLEQSMIDRLIRARQRRYEDHCLATYDAVWVCSDTDRRILLSRQPRAAVQSIPNSVFLADIVPRAAGKDLNFLFVGKMSYSPNYEGMIWFCKEVWPRVQAASTQKLVLTIVGFDPPAEVKALERAGEISVTGGVDSVDPYYWASDIVVAPIRAGGGTRIKILEAMSHAKPVISTTKGAEGIEVEAGKNIMIGDTPNALTEACLELIRNLEKRHAIAQMGRRLIEEKYSDKIISAAINRAI